MIPWIIKQYFRLQIKFLVAFKPTVLFDRINSLSWYKNMLHEWIDNQKFITNSKILEVACATGSLTHHLAQLDHAPTGIDYSSKMIELAKTNHFGINFSIASVLDLPFKNASFDAVIAASLINIVSDKTTAMGELFRTCKKGGIVTILVPSTKFNDNDLHSLQASLMISGFSASALEAWHNLAPKMDANDILNLFEEAGLTKVTTRKYLQGMIISISGIKP